MNKMFNCDVVKNSVYNSNCEKLQPRVTTAVVNDSCYKLHTCL